MHFNIRLFRAFSFLFISTLLFAFLIWERPIGVTGIYYDNWVVDVTCLYLSIIILVGTYVKGLLNLMSPLAWVSTIYILLFFITPLYDIYTGDTSIFGVVDLFEYGVIGTIMAFGGFSAFVMGFVICDSKKRNVSIVELSSKMKRQIARIMLHAWLIIFVIAVWIVILDKGYSIVYIFTFGIWGEAPIEDETSPTFLGFISQATRSIIPVCLLYISFSDNRLAKVILFFLTAMLEIIGGFRYMIIIFIGSYLILFYLRKRKEIPLLSVLIMIVVFSFLVGLIGYTRDSVRIGMGFNAQGFGIQDIVDAVIGNFRIYLSYYAVIKAVPDMTPYIYFDQIVIYTLIMAVPRAIWPSKPLNPGTAPQLLGMNEAAVNSGYAYPCLGEYYYGFGFLGIIFFMLLLGLLFGHISKKYRYNSRTIVDLVIFSVATPMTLQLLIRGYTPSNFYLVLAMLLPGIILNRYIKKNKMYM